MSITDLGDYMDAVMSTNHNHLSGLSNNDHVHYVNAPNHTHGHVHTWTNVPPSAGWMFYDNNTTDWRYSNGTIDIGSGYRNDSIYVNDKNLTEAIEDMAFVLKAMAEKYDLKEVKPMIENEAIKAWADAGEKRILGDLEKKEKEQKHIDDKLFEI